MKGFMVIVIVAAIFGTTFAFTALKKEPYRVPDCNRPENVWRTFPNPSDCSTYYRCDKNDAVLVKCPTGLWYNSWTLVCDFPELIPAGVCRPPLDP